MEENKFLFKCLEREEIEECSKLITHVFSKYDPFMFQLKINEEEILKIVTLDLKNIVDDLLVIICKDKYNKIVGCYAGFKLNKLDIMNRNTKPVDKLIFRINKNNLSNNEKLEILEKIDYHLLKNIYEIHKEKAELNNSIFCDYYCISEKYFQSNLAKDLALNFFTNCLNKGIKHIYGSFFNIKAIKLLTKYFPAKVVREIEVIFDEESEKQEYKILLLGGNGELVDSKLRINPKF